MRILHFKLSVESGDFGHCHHCRHRHHQGGMSHIHKIAILWIKGQAGWVLNLIGSGEKGELLVGQWVS